MTTSAALSLGYVAIYVALGGVASFIEKPAGRGFGAFQLNALIRAGSLAAARAGLSYRCTTMTSWQCERSARSPCLPILMLR
jgi:hypothetical protein